METRGRGTDGHSLLEDVVPPSTDEVPGQGLTGHVVGDVHDGGGGVLLTDTLWVQSEVQVPGGSRSKKTGVSV